MSRTALIASLATLMLIADVAIAGKVVDPHLSRIHVPEGCAACHVGHGQSESPMMPRGQKEVCLSCHGEAQVAIDADPENRPTRLPTNTLFTHPIDEEAFRAGEGTVTCSSCHSPHRGMDRLELADEVGGKRFSPRNPRQFEHELCEGCHTRGPGATDARLSVAERVSAANRSYHPVQAPAAERSASVKPELSAKEINCTDCHGDSRQAESRGVHGSNNPGLLTLMYSVGDGAEESDTTYELCYDCHGRGSILADETFPEHRRHIAKLKISCSACHDPHGSVDNRALIRIGDGAGYSPSISTGLIGFESIGPGSGACYVTCHGRDHGPESYGSMELLIKSGAKTPTSATSPTTTRRRPTRPRPTGGPSRPGPPTRVDDPNP